MEYRSFFIFHTYCVTVTRTLYFLFDFFVDFYSCLMFLFCRLAVMSFEMCLSCPFISLSVWSSSNDRQPVECGSKEKSGRGAISFAIKYFENDMIFSSRDGWSKSYRLVNRVALLLPPLGMKIKPVLLSLLVIPTIYILLGYTSIFSPSLLYTFEIFFPFHTLIVFFYIQ